MNSKSVCLNFLVVALLFSFLFSIDSYAGRTSIANSIANPRAAEIRARASAERELKKAQSESIFRRLMENPLPIGVEILLAGDGKELGSGYGHALLRFVSAEGRPLDDTVISFVAEVTDPEIDVIKAFNGSYAAIVVAEPLSQILSRYAYGEHRDLTRYPIPTSIEQRRLLLANLNEIVHRKSKYPLTYAFAWRNCMTLLMQTLRGAKILNTTSTDLRPSELPKVIEQTLMSPYPGISMTSWKQLSQIAGLIPEQVDNWPERDTVVARIPVRELIQMIILNVRSFDTKSISLLMSAIPKGAELDTAKNDPFLANHLSFSYYQLVNDFSVPAKSYWSHDLLRRHCRMINLTLKADSIRGQPFKIFRDSWIVFQPLVEKLCAGV